MSTIGLIVLLLSVGLGALFVLFFAVLGILYTTRRTPLRRVRGFGGDTDAPDVADPLFLRTVSLVTRTPMQAGNVVDVFGDGRETFARLWDDLAGAERTITIAIYYAEPGNVARLLQETLEERARAGVAVFFLYDAFGAGELGDAYFQSLMQAGVRVASYRPVRWYSLHKAQERSHLRGLVIDARLAYTGGLGIADQWLGDGRQSGSWRDTNVRFAGPAVQQLQAAFITSWVEATGDLLTSRDLLPDGAGMAMAGERPSTAGADSGSCAGLLFSAPSLGSTSAERVLALSIAGARRRLYLTSAYFVPDDDFRGLLASAARRGVDVRLLVPGAHSDVPLAREAGRAQYDPLLSAGVRIYEYSPAMVHAKTLVADGCWSLVGTMNFDNRSLALNNEVVLLVSDAGIGARLESLFRADLERSEEIDLVRFRRRSWIQRAREGIGTIVSRLL
jgi:cardiolipin synthase A/B